MSATEEHLRSLGEVSDHVFYLPVVTPGGNAAVAIASTSGNGTFVVPFNMNVVRTFIYAGSAPSATAAPAEIYNLQRTPASGAAASLLYNTSITSCSAAITSTQTTIPVSSNTGFPGPGGIPIGVVAQGGDAGVAGPEVPGSAGYPGPTPPQFVINIGSELAIVTGGQGSTTWTATRGAFGTTAASATANAGITLMNRPFLLNNSNSNVLTTGTSPNLVPWLWSAPENPLLVTGDILQVYTVLAGATTAGSKLTVALHVQKA
jgi:hypothetical protein